MSHRHEIDSILKRVETWPPEDRRALAIELLQRSTTGATLPPRDTLSQARAIAGSRTGPAPTDEEVKQWIDEHRMAKYGGGVR